MLAVPILVTKCVDDSQYPTIVECRLTDARGQEWTIVEKTAVLLCPDNLDRFSAYPVRAAMACVVKARGRDNLGQDISEIEPRWAVESTDGTNVFVVRSDQVFEWRQSVA